VLAVERQLHAAEAAAASLQRRAEAAEAESAAATAQARAAVARALGVAEAAVHQAWGGTQRRWEAPLARP
jgi:hypothetical protein